MRYATGLKNGEDAGLNADITGADVLHGFVGECMRRRWVITSALRDSIAVPAHLEGMKVLGSLMVQKDDGTEVGDDTVYVIEDENEERESDKFFRRCLEIDSAGTGVAVLVIPVLNDLFTMEISYGRLLPDGTLLSLYDIPEGGIPAED